MKDGEFEWHDRKAETNANAHGITFEAACKVFDDNNAIWDDDLDASWDEDRYRVIGCVERRIIFVCYTYRDGDADSVIRLISARPATKREINDYYRSQTAP